MISSIKRAVLQSGVHQLYFLIWLSGYVSDRQLTDFIWRKGGERPTLHIVLCNYCNGILKFRCWICSPCLNFIFLPTIESLWEKLFVKLFLSFTWLCIKLASVRELPFSNVGNKYLSSPQTFEWAYLWNLLNNVFLSFFSFFRGKMKSKCDYVTFAL